MTLSGALSTPVAGSVLADWYGPILFGPPHAREDRWPAPNERLSLYHTYAGEAFAVDADGDRYRAMFDVVHLDPNRAEVRDHALRWLGRHYGIEVGIGCPAWVYSAATRDSVASWSLIGVDGKRYVFCNYPPDIEANLGPPVDRETYANLRNLPTDPLEALVAACVHAAGQSLTNQEK